MCSITAAGPAANRPPHIRFALPWDDDTVNPSSTIPAALCVEGGGLVLKRVVPALLGAVLVAAAGWIGLQYWDAGALPWMDGAKHAAGPPISGTVAKFTPTDPGRPAPIEPFYDADGNEITLHDFGDKVVLLNLWATWCAPCIREMPSLDRLQAALGGDRFQVVAVSVDRRGVEAVRPYFQRLEIANLSIYVEPTNQLANALGLQVLPSTIVVGPRGLMRGHIIGAVEWDAPEALALLRYYIDRVGAGG
jgi:thiol-disulfide isomerase/thioredoxin